MTATAPKRFSRRTTPVDARAVTRCPLCEPDAHEILLENSDALVMIDVRPMCAGHVLVVPRGHESSVRSVVPNRLKGLMDLATTAARVLERRWGEAGMYEHGGGPLCRPHLARVSSAHAHLHILPISTDIVSRLPAGLRADRSDVVVNGLHYLWQRAGPAGDERSTDLIGGVPPHITRTLLQLAFDEYAQPWIPLSAAPRLHERAIAETRATFAARQTPSRVRL